MPLITLREALTAAEDGGYAVGAFNVSDLNQAYSVLEAARQSKSPVIVQSIAGMNPYADEGWWWDRLRELVVSYDDVSAVLHLDHGSRYTDCIRAIEHGFTSVMIDASRDVKTGEASTFEHNVELTRSVVEYAHARGVSVEGELGTIGGAETPEDGVVEEIVFTDPMQAADFVRLTDVDALAVAVGTSHGSVKFTDAEGGQRLRIGLIEKIKSELPQTYLVLHGSSSVPQDAVATINANGGSLPESYGLNLEQKQEGIAAGIRKINQGTDSHLVWTAALRELLAKRPSEVEPSQILSSPLTAMQELTAQRMREFGSAGQTA
jgi:fructose-bisphosphate aldolase class II